MIHRTAWLTTPSDNVAREKCIGKGHTEIPQCDLQSTEARTRADNKQEKNAKVHSSIKSAAWWICIVGRNRLPYH